jgi:hypothetical protein
MNVDIFLYGINFVDSEEILASKDMHTTAKQAT